MESNPYFSSFVAKAKVASPTTEAPGTIATTALINFEAIAGEYAK